MTFFIIWILLFIQNCSANKLINLKQRYRIKKLLNFTNYSFPKELNIFSNPNDGFFNVELNGSDELIELYILDMAGRKTAFYYSLNKTNITFDIEENNTGIFSSDYYNKNAYSKKLVVK